LSFIRIRIITYYGFAGLITFFQCCASTCNSTGNGSNTFGYTSNNFAYTTAYGS
jgi:hypothetical protein